MISYSIYVVDDEKLIREAFELTLGKIYCVQTFSTAEEALEAIGGAPPDLMLLDIGLPGISGIDALKKIKQLCPDILIIMITAHDDIDTVISAMKSGAYDYVVKPINMEALEVNISNALETIKLRKEVQILQERHLEENNPFFIAESDALQEVMALVEMVAQSPDASVLILGETGTGKELIASTIHYKSPNFRGPFVTLNCSAIPDELIESELFGYEKGAFSGAAPAGKTGMVESAAEGTLFLDEVGDLSLKAQASLLRFLENGEYYKVGGTRKYQVKTRVVAATNKNLTTLISQNLFREDLYYRLAIIKIEVPSLNKRPDDIMPMARHFLLALSRKMGKSFSGFAPESELALRNYPWRGNVRELRNLIERAVLIGRGPEVTVKDLGIEGHHERDNSDSGPDGGDPETTFPLLSPEGIDLPRLHDDLDAHYFRASLRETEGNAAKAARLLGMSYYAFRRRRDKLSL